MFYSRPEALNPARNGSLGLATRADFSFARPAHAIPVVASEMPAAMRSYPIVFIGDANAPVIITGLRQDENLFVDADQCLDDELEFDRHQVGRTESSARRTDDGVDGIPIQPGLLWSPSTGVGKSPSRVH